MKNKIIITAKSTYLPEQSFAEQQRFLWSYEITIKSEGEEMIQLLNRYWRITDMSGQVEVVHGPGVVGLQPILRPEKPFIYTSFCQLATPQGTMEGHFKMQTLNEESFEVPIPKFLLTSPVAEFATYRSLLH